MVKVALVLAAALVLGSSATQARMAVSITVTPRISPAPATVRINVTVEPDNRNRFLVLEADSGDFYTSSSIELDGSNAGRLQPFTFVDLPPGQYLATARVVRSDGDERRAMMEYMVTD
jgi:hypothetical protein